MIQKFRNRLSSAFEEGFSLAEMVVVVLILGVLAAISVPVYLGIQSQASTTTVKTGLLQAATLIEQSKTDLDGMYPRYVPNTVTQNELWKTFAYTYSDDRLTFCLQAFDNNNTAWFVSSVNKEPSQTICTQPNIGSNSTLPWAPNTPPVINVDSLVMTWPAQATTPTANLSWTAATCTNRDQTITPSTQYNVKLVDVSANVTANLKGLVGTNVSTSSLPGFLPSDTVQAYIQVVCVTQPASINSQTYYTNGAFSPNPATAVTPALPVPDTAFTSAPASSLSYNTSTQQWTMTSTGSLAAVTCPIGTAQYQITAAEPNASGVAAVSSTVAASGSSISWTLTGFQPDTKIVYTGYAYCVIQRNNSASTLPSSYASAPVSSNEYAPVGWPVNGATNLATTAAYSGTGTTPNGLTWTAVTCSFGGTARYSYVQDDPIPAPANGSYQADNYTTGDATKTDSAGAISWVQGRSYTYHINAKCVGSNPVESQVTASNALKFTTDVTVPTPSYSSTPSAYFTADGTQMHMQATFNAITCPGDNSVAEYSLTATQGGKSASSPPAQSPSVDFDITSLATNTSTMYTGFAYCYVSPTNATKYGTTVQVYSSSVTTTATTPGVAPTITTTSLPYGVNGTAYSQTVAANGTPAPTFSVTSGSLPSGLNLNASNGVISGTPNNSNTFSFSIKASSLAGSATQNYSITIYSPPSITTSGLSDAVVGSGYSQTINASGDDTITYTNTSGGNSYNGLTLNSNGVINGTPNAAGTWSFTVQASSKYGTTTKNLSINIYQGARWNSGNYPTSYNGSYYSNQVTGYGSGSLTYQYITGTIPSGLNLDTGSGTLYGTPTGAQSFSFVLRVYNNWGYEDRTFYVDTYKAPSITGGGYCSVTTDVSHATGCGLTFTTGYPNSSVSFDASNGGSLPPGVGVANNGYISGTPNTTGSYGMSVRICNNYTCSGNTGVGTETVNAYDQYLNGTNSSAGWSAQSNMDSPPCNMYYGCSGNASPPTTYNGSYVTKMLSTASGTGTQTTINGTTYYGKLGQATQSLSGIVPNHTYTYNCTLGWATTTSSASTTTKPASGLGISQFGVNISGSTYSTKNSPSAGGYYSLGTTWSTGNYSATLAAEAINSGTGQHEWYATNCYVNW